MNNILWTYAEATSLRNCKTSSNSYLPTPSSIGGGATMPVITSFVLHILVRHDRSQQFATYLRLRDAPFSKSVPTRSSATNNKQAEQFGQHPTAYIPSYSDYAVVTDSKEMVTKLLNAGADTQLVN
jgi:hypothetical protein